MESKFFCGNIIFIWLSKPIMQDFKNMVNVGIPFQIVILETKRCTIQEADLSEDLVVDRETYGCAKSLWYLGYTLVGEKLWSEVVDEVLIVFVITNTQSSSDRDEMLSVCKLCQKQYIL